MFLCMAHFQLAKGEEDLDSNGSFSEDTTTDEGEDSFNEAEVSKPVDCCVYAFH